MSDTDTTAAGSRGAAPRISATPTSLNAGPSLDAEISRVVFSTPTHVDAEGVLWELDGGIVPRYSTDVAAAWRIVERCTAIDAFGYRDVNGLPVATWFMANFAAAALWSCTASEAAERICLAALAAGEGRRKERFP